MRSCVTRLVNVEHCKLFRNSNLNIIHECNHTESETFLADNDELLDLLAMKVPRGRNWHQWAGLPHLALLSIESTAPDFPLGVVNS